MYWFQRGCVIFQWNKQVWSHESHCPNINYILFCKFFSMKMTKKENFKPKIWPLQIPLKHTSPIYFFQNSVTDIFWYKNTFPWQQKFWLKLDSKCHGSLYDSRSLTANRKFDWYHHQMWVFVSFSEFLSGGYGIPLNGLVHS